MTRSRVGPLALVGVVLLIGATSAPADTVLGQAQVAPQETSAPTGEALEKLTSQVASQLRCPVCRQLSVEDSQAELSKQVRKVIRERLAAGQSPEEVKAYFVSKYGPWILLSPPKQGVTLLVWVLPVLALLGGGVVLGLFLRTWLTGGGGRGGEDGHDDHGDGERGFTAASASLHEPGGIFDAEGAAPSGSPQR